MYIIKMFFSRPFLNNISIVESVGACLNKKISRNYCNDINNKITLINYLIKDIQCNGLTTALATLFNIKLESKENSIENQVLNRKIILNFINVNCQVLCKNNPEYLNINWDLRNEYLNALSLQNIIILILSLGVKLQFASKLLAVVEAQHPLFNTMSWPWRNEERAVINYFNWDVNKAAITIEELWFNYKINILRNYFVDSWDSIGDRNEVDPLEKEKCSEYYTILFLNILSDIKFFLKNQTFKNKE